MENSTKLPLVSDCMTQEHEGLYVAAMAVLSAIWTLMAILVRNDRRLARARSMMRARAPSPAFGERKGKRWYK